mmetsp:Transcript_25922/g.78003  ORF Transcript_25922/g.78003 Transcript_25922/m.78003 type:complete len:276 (-) Transcript_25922:21-848(-)
MVADPQRKEYCLLNAAARWLYFIIWALNSAVCCQCEYGFEILASESIRAVARQSVVVSLPSDLTRTSSTSRRNFSLDSLNECCGLILVWGGSKLHMTPPRKKVSPNSKHSGVCAGRMLAFFLSPRQVRDDDPTSVIVNVGVDPCAPLMTVMLACLLLTVFEGCLMSKELSSAVLIASGSTSLPTEWSPAQSSKDMAGTSSISRIVSTAIISGEPSCAAASAVSSLENMSTANRNAASALFSFSTDDCLKNVTAASRSASSAQPYRDSTACSPSAS